jgi:hypothetical protein
MTQSRLDHAATLLPDGTVLVTGGRHLSMSSVDSNQVTLASAELYDPGRGVWTATGSMTTPRADLRATLLPGGTVLVTGGISSFPSAEPYDPVPASLPSAELFDPGSGTWTATGYMTTPRYGHTATLLHDGTVLVAGGSTTHGTLASAELYDPGSGTR